MNKAYKILSLIFILIIIICNLASAKYIDSAKYIISEPENQNLNIYTTSLNVENTVNGSLKSLNTNTIINKPINGELVILTGDIEINSDIDGSTTIIATNAKINGNINGDLIIYALNTEITNTSKITGDIIINGYSTIIKGNHSGETVIHSSSIYFDGTINNNVVFDSEDLIIKEGSYIQGNLGYSSIMFENLKIADGKQVLINNKTTTEKILSLIAIIIMFLLPALTIEKLYPNSFKITNKSYLNPKIKQVLTGLGLLIISIILSIIFLISKIGLILGLMTTSVIIIIIITSIIHASYALGESILTNITKKEQNSKYYLIFGIILYILLIQIPIVNSIIIIITLSIGFNNFYKTFLSTIIISNWMNGKKKLFNKDIKIKYPKKKIKNKNNKISDIKSIETNFNIKEDIKYNQITTKHINNTNKKNKLKTKKTKVYKTSKSNSIGLQLNEDED